MIVTVTDIKDERVKVFSSLTEAQLMQRAHPSDGLFIAESVKVIEYALSKGYEPVSLLMLTEDIISYGYDFEKRFPDIPIYTAERDVLSSLTGFDVKRSIMCAMRRKPTANVNVICKNARRLAILEHITDPTNIGAIFRSAAALGMDGILLSESCCDPLYRRCARVSMGAVFLIPWTVVKGKDGTCIDIVQKHRFYTAALCLSEKSVSIDDLSLSLHDRIALVFGSEGRGLGIDTVKKCDASVIIPMANGVDSLNVAAASAVAFREICRR